MSGFRQLCGLFLIVGGFTLMGCWVEFLYFCLSFVYLETMIFFYKLGLDTLLF